jgi:hypothetical protein
MRWAESSYCACRQYVVVGVYCLPILSLSKCCYRLPISCVLCPLLRQ